MKEFQKRKIEHLFNYLDQHNKYYHNTFKKYGIDLSAEGDEMLEKMPILLKADIRKNAGSYFSDADVKLVRELTSGSVGVPLTCYKSVQERSQAAMNVWKARRERDPYVSPQNYYNFFDANEHVTGDFANLNDEQMATYFNQLKTLNLRWMSGPISTIYTMAKLINKGKIFNNSIKYIELFGEYVDPEQRAYIEEAFGCKTVVHYGTRETWCIGYECEKGFLHVQENVMFVETNDKNVQYDDGNSEIIVTSLYNRYMPFIRYNLMDIGKLVYDTCECGKTSPRIILAGGRVGDIVKGKQVLGNNFFNRAVGHLVKRGYDDIQRFRAEQVELNHFILYIVKAETYTDETTQVLKSILKEALGNDSEFTFKFVDRIDALPNGKYKNFQCLI